MGRSGVAAIACCLLASSAGYVPQISGPAWAAELTVARNAVNAAAGLHGRPQQARQRLERELSDEAGRRWLSHVDAHGIVLSLWSSADACSVVSLVWRSASRETAFASLDGGCYVQSDGGEAAEANAGGASMHANVLHAPAGWCPQLDDLLTHLQDTGTGIPVEVTPRQGTAGDDGGGDGTGGLLGPDYCEGLLDVCLGRADMHVAPPGRFLAWGEGAAEQPVPPLPVLSALELLLDESGGILSDVYGEPLGLKGAMADEAPDGDEAASLVAGGLFACEAASHNYYLRATRSAFPRADGAMRVDLASLGEKLRGFDDFRREYTVELGEEDEGGEG